MTLLTLVSSYLRSKWFNTLLYTILMALGVALMTSFLLFGDQMAQRLYRDGTGIDAVVGAKGSPLQLILSSVQHADIPTGNIPLRKYEEIKRHRHVKEAIPISLGDNYQQYRIIGTEASYLKHFKAELAKGHLWQGSMQAILGAKVAHDTRLKLGESFIGSHGLSHEGHHHEDTPYHVTGILKPTGTVLDRLIITSLDSVWDIHAPHQHQVPTTTAHSHHSHHKHSHEHHHAHDSSHHHDEHSHTKAIDKDITAVLIKYRSQAAALSFPQQINRETSLQAASPALEIARLADIIGIGSQTVFSSSVFLISIALISIFIGLINSIQERQYDIAIFRTLGASRQKVMAIILLEGLSITFIGSLLGLVAGHSFIEVIGLFTEKGNDIGLRGFYFLPEVWGIWSLILFLATIICLVPAWKTYQSTIQTTLKHA